MKSVLIIGATSSIAENCARLWAVSGYKMHLVARNNERVRIIAADLMVRGASQVTTYFADVNDISRHNILLDAADKAMSGVDIVLIAHGTLTNQKSCEQSVDETLAEIQTNALSTISLLTLIANRFEAKRAGKICVISSVAGDRGRASNYIYGSAKAMITTYTSGLRQRLHSSNVAVITIKPGFVDTPMTANFKKGVLWAKPKVVALQIIKSIDSSKSEVYVPFFWRIVMMIIKSIPSRLFNKIDL
jgi:decaprenylphospho-beta-D-erythro-pentofuranosid-2-ulose 2-reductase